MKNNNIKLFMLAFLMLGIVQINAQILEKAPSTETTEAPRAHEQEEIEEILKEHGVHAQEEGKTKKAKKGMGKGQNGGLLPGEGFYMRDKRIQQALNVLERKRAEGKISDEKYASQKSKLEAARKGMYKDKTRRVPKGHKKRMDQMEKEKQKMKEERILKSEMTEEQKAKRKERLERFEEKRAERKEKTKKGNEWTDKLTDEQREKKENAKGKGKAKWNELGDNTGKKGARVDMREAALKERLDSGIITQEEYNKRMEQMAKRNASRGMQAKEKKMRYENKKERMKKRADASIMERDVKQEKLDELKKNLEERKAAGTITNQRYKSAMKQIEQVEEKMEKLKEKEAKAANM